MVIPKQHIDHFTRMSDELASKIMVIAQKYGRRLMSKNNALRIGYLVHAFGVPRAHLHVVPMFHSNGIISSKYVSIEDGEVVIVDQDLPFYSRQDLDSMAKELRHI